jgi:hypothetical protein
MTDLGTKREFAELRLNVRLATPWGPPDPAAAIRYLNPTCKFGFFNLVLARHLQASN